MGVKYTPKQRRSIYRKAAKQIANSKTKLYCCNEIAKVVKAKDLNIRLSNFPEFNLFRPYQYSTVWFGIMSEYPWVFTKKQVANQRTICLLLCAEIAMDAND